VRESIAFFTFTVGEVHRNRRGGGPYGTSCVHRRQTFFDCANRACRSIAFESPKGPPCRLGISLAGYELEVSVIRVGLTWAVAAWLVARQQSPQ
jgi:hypothetical protein